MKKKSSRSTFLNPKLVKLLTNWGFDLSTQIIKFTKSELIGSGGAPEIHSDCPGCGKTLKLTASKIRNEESVVCDECGLEVQIVIVSDLEVGWICEVTDLLKDTRFANNAKRLSICN
jgi:hypothetical protein